MEKESEKIEEDLKKTVQNSIKDYPKFDLQFNSEGIGKGSFDLTVGKMFQISGKGKMDFSDNEREIAETKEIEPEKEKEDDKYGWWNLEEGVYSIEVNEKISLPENQAGRVYSRASLLKNGAFIVPCYLEKGFDSEKSDSGNNFTLIVQNPKGIDIKENARILQIVFERS